MNLKLSLPVIVEGKYDKIKLQSILDATVITTGGFSVFNDENKREYIKKLCANGVIIATDSDSAGNMIRAHLRGIVPTDVIRNVYIPQVKGRERRKTSPSAEGYLGLEGTDAGTLYDLFLPYADGGDGKKCRLDRTRLYELGLTGGENSAGKRRVLSRLAGLPDGLTAKALFCAIESTYDADGAEQLLARFEKENE